jgi:hypothetical protein
MCLQDSFNINLPSSLFPLGFVTAEWIFLSLRCEHHNVSEHVFMNEFVNKESLNDGVWEAATPLASDPLIFLCRFGSQVE